MAYDRYYTGGWQDGESGNTPITAAALNHIEDGLVAITEPSTLTITRVANSYCDASSITNMSAIKKNGFLWFNGAISLSANVPNDTSFTEIATISGWSAASTVTISCAGRSSAANLLVNITASGTVRIANFSGSAASGWYLCPMCVPVND